MKNTQLLLNKVIYPSKFKFVEQYKRINEYTPEEINNIRLSKLNNLIRHFSTISFYKDSLLTNFESISSIQSIEILPTIDKQFIRKNLDIIKNIDNKAVMRSTSGSTGDNFYFYVPRLTRAASSAALHDFLSRIGVIDSRGKTIGIWGGNLHKPGEYEPLLSKLKNFILDVEIWPGYGLNEEKSIEYINRINILKPSLLYGYPSYLDLIAKYGLKNNIKAYTPTAIVVSGEQLTNSVRMRIEKYFNTKIYNRYGSVEFGVIAHEMKNDDGMYINPLRFIVESDKNGELLITDLDNYVTPFIRYRIGDLGELTQKGNWQILKSMNGRMNDVIETKSGKIIPSQFFTILSRITKGIEQYQFVQISDTLIEMRIIANDEFDINNVEIIKKNFMKNYGDEIALSIKITETLDTTSFGKHKFVIKKG